jgi:hypothetical protein
MMMMMMNTIGPKTITELSISQMPGGNFVVN